MKIIISITSDDQGSGFGDITLRQIVRPFILIAVISSYGTIFGAFDNFVNKVTVSITASIQKNIPNMDEQYLKAIRDSESAKERVAAAYDIPTDGFYTDAKLNEAADKLAQKKGMNYDMDKDSKELEKIAKDNGYNNIAQGILGFIGGSNNTIDAFRGGHTSLASFIENSTTIDDATKKRAKDLNDRINSGEDFREQFRENFRSLDNNASKLDGWRNWLTIIVNWIFDKFYLIVECFAEIYLVILALLGPVIFALSILSNWENCWKSFVAKYIEISSWKITASIIALVVMTGRYMVTEYNGELYESKLLGNEAAMKEIGNGVAWALKAIFSIAGLLAFKQIPSLTSTLFGLGGGTGGLSGSGVVGAATGAAIKTGKVVGGAISGGVTGGAGGAIAGAAKGAVN